MSRYLTLPLGFLSICLSVLAWAEPIIVNGMDGKAVSGALFIDASVDPTAGIPNW